MPDRLEALDVARLTAESRFFASKLFQRVPSLEAHARMEPRDGSDEFDLLIDVPSPSGDTERRLYLWMESGTEPSLGFGGWHTHRRLETVDGLSLGEADEILDLIEGILADRFILLYAPGLHGEWCELIDSHDPEALIDELTAPLSSGRQAIRTWSGKGDRVATLQDPGPI